MKKFLAEIFAFYLVVLGLPSAQALITHPNQSVTPTMSVIITEPTHRQINGQFIDEGLAKSLSVDGRLGKLVFDPPTGPSRWIIDPALIEEVVAMSNGYQLADGTDGIGQLSAQTWLTQLTIDIALNKVSALAYGNPSHYWVNRLSPHEESYLLTSSKKLLETLLNHPVNPRVIFHNPKPFALSKFDIETILNAATYFRETTSYVEPSTIDTFRLALIKILNLDLSYERREFLIRDFTANGYAQVHLVHLSPGKFTVTSSKQNIPLTLTNKFPHAAKINLVIHPLNAKIRVAKITPEVIPGNSKIQVLIPLTVLTSGSSGIHVEIRTPSGDLLGDPVIYPIKLSVISPVATWFTTGAAMVLFLAATIQGIRRIRRGKK
jgi:hypothetical protein